MWHIREVPEVYWNRRVFDNEVEEEYLRKAEKVVCISKYIYDIYEEPYTPKGDVVKGYAVKGTQLNTKELNTNNKDKLDKPLNSITNELIKRKFIESSDLELFRYDDLFNEILTKCEYRDVIIVVSYIIQKWNENKGLDEDNNKIMDKFNYFKKSLENNLEMITEDIDLGWD